MEDGTGNRTARRPEEDEWRDGQGGESGEGAARATPGALRRRVRAVLARFGGVAGELVPAGHPTSSPGETGPARRRSPTGRRKGVHAGDRMGDEQRLAYEQWLRRIPDDPGGLLRRKFALGVSRTGGAASEPERRLVGRAMSSTNPGWKVGSTVKIRGARIRPGKNAVSRAEPVPYSRFIRVAPEQAWADERPPDRIPLHECGVVPFIRTRSAERANRAVEWLSDAGFRTFELAASIGGIVELVEELFEQRRVRRRRGNGDGARAGAWLHRSRGKLHRDPGGRHGHRGALPQGGSRLRARRIDAERGHAGARAGGGCGEDLSGREPRRRPVRENPEGDVPGRAARSPPEGSR